MFEAFFLLNTQYFLFCALKVPGCYSVFSKQVQHYFSGYFKEKNTLGHRILSNNILYKSDTKMQYSNPNKYWFI